MLIIRHDEMLYLYVQIYFFRCLFLLFFHGPGLFITKSKNYLFVMNWTGQPHKLDFVRGIKVTPLPISTL